MNGLAARLQPLGRALMLPIAVLPIAGILLRLGQPDMLDIGFVAAAGGAIFGHLGLLFAIGVAVGLACENHGAAGLAGVVAYLVTVEGAKALLVVPADVGVAIVDQATRDAVIAAWRTAQLDRLSVPAGILAGLAGGLLYNRFSDIRLPDFLAFFGGRRFVPIAAGFVGLALAAVFGFGFPLIARAIDLLSHWVVSAGPLGLFLYGVLNRLLIVTGLHHILNNIAWFVLGTFDGKTGDLNRFFAGDPAAGGFMAGFFPVMMFGLPAACLAMYRAALPERRNAIGGMLASLAATSFLTGVTEPIEFSFMFLAPLLYAVHAVLTGLAMVVMDALGVRLGFGFSAGLFDYALNFGLATRPLLLLPIGVAYFAVYYVSFSWCIRRFDLKTPGREGTTTIGTVPVAVGARGAAFAHALGGAGNLVTVDACTTRLRLRLADLDAIDEAALRALGARGMIRPGGDALQVVLGPIADQVAGEIRAASQDRSPTTPTNVGRAEALARLLGPDATVEARGSRLLVRFAGDHRPDHAALAAWGARAIVDLGADRLHLIVGPEAADLASRVAGRVANSAEAACSTQASFGRGRAASGSDARRA